MEETRTLKVVFLVGADAPSTRLAIEAVCRTPHVIPAGILLDTFIPPLRSRIKNLRKNVKRDGAGYLYRRAVKALRDQLDAAAAKVVPQKEIRELLRSAFPERSQSLDDIAAGHGFRVHNICNLNSPAAADCLREIGADLGIVIGTRILKRSTFSVPRLGCINLHKGKVPEYRGMPPGFWELYDGATSAGVTIHLVDDGLDSGDVIGTASIPIHPLETVVSLRTKLDHEGARVLAACVAQLQAGVAQRHKQPPTSIKARTKPARVEQVKVQHLLEPENDWQHIIKTVLYLCIFRTGLFQLVRSLRRAPLGRGAIILYHRVNDISQDSLTVSTRIFAEHLVVLKRYYNVVTTAALVDSVKGRRPVPPGSVAIHFDDCYRDVLLEGGRLLRAAGMPAAMFIATGFIDTDRVFDHDRRKYPHRFENLRSPEVPALYDSGFEVGAHTVNHVDLGTISRDTARCEVVESKRHLEQLAARPVRLFSFPFGKESNIRDEVRDILRDTGFDAVFSAHGGFVSGKSDPFDIPRLGANLKYRGLDLMMELEGLSLPQLFPRLRRFLGKG